MVCVWRSAISCRAAAVVDADGGTVRAERLNQRVRVHVHVLGAEGAAKFGRNAGIGGGYEDRSGFEQADRGAEVIEDGRDLTAGVRHLAVVNFSAEPADGRVGLGWTDLRGRGWTLADLLADRVFERSGDELADQGLFVALPPWGCHLLAVR